MKRRKKILLKKIPIFLIISGIVSSIQDLCIRRREPVSVSIISNILSMSDSTARPAFFYQETIM